MNAITDQVAKDAAAQGAKELKIQKDLDAWRAVKPSDVFATSLHQKDYPEWVDQYNKETMSTPNAQEDTRVPSLNKQAADDHWRSVKPAGVFQTLVQTGDNKDYPDWAGEYNKKTMDTANAAEKVRELEVEAQQKSDVWRGVRPKDSFWK